MRNVIRLSEMTNVLMQKFGFIKIAIHRWPDSFSDKWIEFCEENNIAYKLVDCYASDIIEQIKSFDALFWHWHHADAGAVLFARQLIASVAKMGIKVFPNIDTCWHFDDKVGQKYLLEAVNAPLVPTYIFYDKQKAIDWAAKTIFPKVFKLRCGAGSENVRIVRDSIHAGKLIDQAFGKGFAVKNRLYFLRERLWHFKRDKNLKTLFDISKGLVRLIIPKDAERLSPRERNYIYFQEFIPDNDCDIRIIVIGRRAFGIKRMVRKGDFRASGSGRIIYDPSQIPQECIKIAFEVSQKLRPQSLAYDFVFQNGVPLLVEVSYAFSHRGYLPCPGYWDDNFVWYNGKFTPEWFMIEDLLGDICESK